MHRPTARLLTMIIPLAVWGAGMVQAQPAAAPAATTALFSSPDACKREVVKFEEAIGVIRQAQGNEAAAALREKLLPAKVQEDILFKDGYCGIVRYLQDWKLTR